VSEQRICPVCGKTCPVDADGQSGFCNSTKKRWKLEQVPVAGLKPGPLQHQDLPPELLKQARWTYEVVGRFVKPTFEQ
jgi:hypothetical protein